MNNQDQRRRTGLLQKVFGLKPIYLFFHYPDLKVGAMKICLSQGLSPNSLFYRVYLNSHF